MKKIFLDEIEKNKVLRIYSENDELESKERSTRRITERKEREFWEVEKKVSRKCEKVEKREKPEKKSELWKQWMILIHSRSAQGKFWYLFFWVISSPFPVCAWNKYVVNSSAVNADIVWGAPVTATLLQFQVCALVKLLRVHLRQQRNCHRQKHKMLFRLKRPETIKMLKS